MQTSIKLALSIFEGVTVAGATMLLFGCSAHQAPPATPTMSASTPTYRSSSYSYEQPNSPYYTQPGVNGGKPVTLPAIPATNRFDQNTPLAAEVYGALQQKLGSTEVRYVTVQSKGSAVLIGGATQNAGIATKALSIVRQCPGVKSVDDHITVQAG